MKGVWGLLLAGLFLPSVLFSESRLPTSDEHHAIARRASGYHNAADFLTFLDFQEAPAAPTRWRFFVDSPTEFFKQHGFWWLLLFALAGGFLLNLTPCVLPLIPINLAIIGAGFTRASAYALGIALAYGSLGVVAVFTGAMFGSLQASPWFNLVMAALFIALCLALLGVFNIDFTRFQKTAPSKKTYLAVFGAGAVSALLAGACVAPVVAAVLLLSSTLYNEGVASAVLLPLLLGVGMALPWPFAGAGLSLLPRPGAWMRFVKIPFALLFALLVVNHAVAAWRGFQSGGSVSLPSGEHGSGTLPVLYYVTASWCHNCVLMEQTTFQDPRVRERLNDFNAFVFHAENPNDPETAAFLRKYDIKGIPTFLILEPELGSRMLPLPLENTP